MAGRLGAVVNNFFFFHFPVKKEIENDFKKCLSQLVPMLLAPENLIIKQISGQKVKAKELVQYFKTYTNMYKGNELPEPKSMLMVSITKKTERKWCGGVRGSEGKTQITGTILIGYRRQQKRIIWPPWPRLKKHIRI